GTDADDRDQDGQHDYRLERGKRYPVGDTWEPAAGSDRRSGQLAHAPVAPPRPQTFASSHLTSGRIRAHNDDVGRKLVSDSSQNSEFKRGPQRRRTAGKDQENLVGRRGFQLG